MRVISAMDQHEILPPHFLRLTKHDPLMDNIWINYFHSWDKTLNVSACGVFISQEMFFRYIEGAKSQTDLSISLPSTTIRYGASVIDMNHNDIIGVIQELAEREPKVRDGNRKKQCPPNYIKTPTRTTSRLNNESGTSSVMGINTQARRLHFFREERRIDKDGPH